MVYKLTISIVCNSYIIENIEKRGGTMQKFIFNRKYLKDTLKNFTKKDIENYETKRQIITNWNYSLDQSDLMKTKEVSVQGDFLHQIFTLILGYKGRIGENLWNLQVEKKTEIDSTVADGSLGFYSDVISDTRVVIELKDAKTDLDSKQKRENNQTPVEQAFSYQYKHKNCKWVIVSNFKEIRLYNATTMTEYEQFFMADLKENEELFLKFYYLFHKENLIDRDGTSKIDHLYITNEEEEKNITEGFYDEYKTIRSSLYEHIIEFNPSIDELTAFEKTQKILDRFIFVCFCEDANLLPKNIFTQVVEAAKKSFEFSGTKVWDQLKGLFNSIDKGNPDHKINRFNGGLFSTDETLDALIIKDDVFELLTQMATYDFESELSVNILGHVFEQSISDIEEFKAELMGEKVDKNKGARKRDGVFYTPSYITQFMVAETIGKWLDAKKKELGEDKLPILTEEDFKEHRKKVALGSRIRKTTNVELHIDFYILLQEAVRGIKILDPACGSGAFLNAAFDYLYRIGTEINSKLEELTGGFISLFDLDKHILKNNLYGVDLNKESVEITKLSLWLKTANKKDPLTSLDENVLFGNSVINDPSFDKNAFVWEDAFEKVFEHGGFDIIVGNPPYVRVQLLENRTVDYLFSNYKTAVGKIDISILFFEKAWSLLNENGEASFISTSQWLQTDYGKGIREFMSQGYISEVIDFGSLPIFGNVDTYPAIFNFKKTTTPNLNYKKIDSLDEFKIQDATFTPFSYENLSIEPWNFSGFNLISHLKNKNIEFRPLTYYADPLYGITTGMDKALVVTEDQVNELNLEHEILYPYAYRGEEIRRFRTVTPQSYIIYPFKEDENNQLQLIEEKVIIKEFPHVYSYLLNFKESLMLRKDSRKLYAATDWYTLVRPGNLQMIYNKKILLKGIGINVECGILGEKTAFNGANCPGIILNSDKISFEYLLGILNSDLTTVYLNAIVPKKLGGYFRYNTTNLKNIPIVVPEDKDLIEEIEIAVSKNIDLRTKIEDQKGRFLRRMENNLEVKKITRKLEDFENLSYKEWLTEIKKQKVSLSLTQQDEWEEYFTSFRKVISQEESIFESNSKEINKLINKIYGL